MVQNSVVVHHDDRSVMVIKACASKVNVGIFVVLERFTYSGRQHFPVRPRRTHIRPNFKTLLKLKPKTSFTRQIFNPKLSSLLCKIETPGICPVNIRINILLVKICVIQVTGVQ